MNEKGFEFSFGWIFAIIVGAVIISLAVYGAVRLGSGERNVQNSQIAQQLGSLMNPMEASMEESKTGSIEFQSETRLYMGCDSKGTFGDQGIAVSTNSQIGEKWQSPGVNLTAKNKYIFSQKMIQGKKFIFFSKRFEMPFQVTSINFMWDEGKRYCFVDAPTDVEDELRQLFVEPNITKSIELSQDTKDCSKSSIKVCFSSSGCDVDVYTDSGKVVKSKQSLYYTGPLLYGAIFSDPSSYECQVIRLMKRTSELAGLYLAKTQYIVTKSGGCGQSIQSLLASFQNQTASASSKDIPSVKLVAEEIRRTNEGISTCKIF